MSLPTNIGAVDLTSADDVKKYYNNYYTQEWTVSSEVNDAVLGYFETVTGSTESAKILASGIIFTSVTQGIDPMHTLTEFTKVKPGELNNYLAMFLNYNRIGTSMLGVNSAPEVNKYIKRCILP
jgi:hypothetical protein